MEKETTSDRPTVAAERELRQQREWLRVTLTSIGDAVIATDAAGRITFLNPVAASLTGWTAEEALRQPVERVFRIVNEETGRALDEPVARVLGEGRAVALSHDAALVTKEGRTVPVEDSASPILDASGRVIGAVLVFHDVTEKRRAEEALRQARDELEIRVKQRTAELQEANDRLREENRERMRTEQSLRLEETRLDALLHLSRIGDAPLDEMTGFTLEQAIALTQSKIGFLGFLNEDETVYTMHSVSRDVVKECNVAGNPIEWLVTDAGIWADAIRQRRTLFVNDYGKPHPRKKGLPPGHLPLERFMVVPVLEGERIVAVAGVANKASDYDKSDERQIVLLLSGMCGCLQKSRSREELERAYNKLEEKVEQRTAELAASAAALEESQKDLTRAQAVGHLGSWRLDVPQNVLHWSDENHRIFGIPQGQPLRYETFLATVHPDDRPYVDARWTAALRGEPYDIEHRIVVNGAVKWVREKAYLEFDEAGRLRGGFGITQDITDRKQAEHELRTLAETLEQQVAERTAVAERRARDLRRLAAELSEAEHGERKRLAQLLHDELQQLLLAVKLRLPVLVKEDPSQQKQHVERLDQLIGECLSTSRNLTQELSPPILQYGTLAEVVEWLGKWFGEKHGLSVAVEAHDKLPPAPEHVRIFLFQAARELLMNVVKHSGNMEARVALSSRGPYLAVQVEDGGNGFDPQAVEARLERPEGFGLFNIRERLEALGGRLEIQTTPQGGACFRLVVPRAEGTEWQLEDTGPQRVKMASSRPRKSRVQDGVVRVLVVDDHAVVREGFAGLLDRQSDFEVVGEAADGEQAVQQAEALQPDAIIMDVDMPAMNGIEATRRIKHRQPEIVIVGLSLHEETSVARAMTEAGADAYVPKHAPAKDVVEAVRRACSIR